MAKTELTGNDVGGDRRMEVCAKQISKQFRRKRNGSNVFTAVEPSDIQLSPGILTVARGRSGSGKSTLLNMLAGILTPDSGSVEYDGVDLYAMKDEELSRFRNENIGYIPQGRSAVDTLTVLENVMLPLILYGERDEKKAMDLLDRFGIADLKDMKMQKLSGGELRRLAIARALMRDPKVLFADEPTGDLDDENTKVVFGALRDIAKSGTAVLVVTHEEDVQDYTSCILNMESGSLS